MEDFTITKGISNYIIGQKRTGKNKQFVFITPDIVIKGPYQEGRLNNVINRSHVFNTWNTPLVIKAINYFSSTDGIFVRFPNIMKDYNLTSEPYFESFSGLTYNILTNPPVDKLRNVLPNNPWIIDMSENLILALVHCNILNVGDMNFSNILVDPAKRQIYIIDFDDNLSKDRDDPVFYLNKPPAAKLNWYERVKKFYVPVAEKIKLLLDDDVVKLNNLQPRVERCIRLLMYYGSNNLPTSTILLPIPTIPLSSTAIPLPSPGIPLSSTAIPLPSTPIPLQSTPIPLPSPTIPFQSPIIPVPLPLVEAGNQGLMVWKGLRRNLSKTCSGIDFDVAKSALQKYIRRNMPEKAILAAIELYRFGECENGAAGVTNMYNRISISAAEDIGPANLPLTLAVIQFVKSKDRNIYNLVPIVHLMATSPKTRLMSHAWTVYATPEGREKAIKLGINIDTSLTESDTAFVNKNFNSDIFLPDDPAQLRAYILIFLKRLIDQDFNVFSWVYFYLNSIGETKISKRRKFINPSLRGTTGQPEILLWKALAKVLPTETHDILVGAYFDHTESRPFLQLAIILALYRVGYAPYDFTSAVNIWNNNKSVIDDMLQGKHTLVIDDFVKDKHTNAGRRLGKGIKDFVTEGSLVIPQDETFYIKLFHDIYQDRE